MAIDSHTRSVAKGITWRLLGTIDTIIISFIINGTLNTALKIGFTEVITKVALFYFHERLWTLLYFNKGFKSTRTTAIIKAVSWRTVGTIDTMLLAWFYTGDPMQGLKIGATEFCTKVILYYFHERVWARVKWGLRNDSIKEETF
jgi:uncharacterized membrane protein